MKPATPAGARIAETSSAGSVGIRTRRRVTGRLMPFLVISYLLAYIDRANLSVAKLQMQTALGFTDRIVGFGAGIFFLGYFLLEVPGTLIVERYGARKWFARIMITWGIMAALTGFIGTPAFAAVSTRHQFYAVRFLLGAAEAGFFPGVIVYLSHWFRYEDRTRAKAWFMITQPLSVVVGVPVSRWILDRAHWAGLPGWRWVFILEGIPPIVLGVAALFYLTDRVSEASWLREDEREWLTAELRREEREKIAAGRVRALNVFRRPEILLLTAVFFLAVTSNQALLFFLPSITERFRRLSVVWRTILAAAPYLFSIVGILINGFLSNRTGERRWHTAVPILLTSAAFACAILAQNNLALVVCALCGLGLCFQAYLPVFWTLPTTLLGKTAAALAVGLINSFGNLGGFAGPYVFGYFKTATGSYQTGLWFLALCTLASGLLATQIRIAPPRSKRINGQTP